MYTDSLGYVVEPMRLSDVPAVLAIERVSFPLPWPARVYQYELLKNDRSHYFVLRHRGERDRPEGILARLWRALRPNPPSEVVGYGGFWTSGHQAHISTLAIAPKWRRQGLGLLLVLYMLDCARALGMRTATLEVRVSNHAAQNLYRKCGFRPSGLLRGYYHDNGEDALLMTTPPLTNPAYEAHLNGLWQELQKRLGAQPQEEKGE